MRLAKGPLVGPVLCRVVSIVLARAGDGLFVSGLPGLAGAGLAILERGKKPRTAGERRAVAKFLRPEPRLDLGRALAKPGAARPSAVTDTSDGLAVDAAKIGRATDDSGHVSR